MRIVSSTATLPPALKRHLADRKSGAVSDLTADLPEHVVVWGDTLFGIASRYGTTLSALQQLNELPDPDRLEVGQRLKLPGAPQATTPEVYMLPDHLLYRSIGAQEFDIDAFVAAQPGPLRRLSSVIVSRGGAGEVIETRYSASHIVERVSLEFSVDARLLLALLDYRAGLLTDDSSDESRQIYPFISPENGAGVNRAGLYAQLSWMADQLNQGFYGSKYRGRDALEFDDGSRLRFHPELNAGTIALQYALAQFRDSESWRRDVGSAGFIATYQRHFGAEQAEAGNEDGPPPQPPMTLPFGPSQDWRFTGSFHGGWGNGSAWAAIDFAPPFEEDRPYACFTSTVPLTAIARGVIARLAEGVVVLDLDLDGDEGSGWTVLYLHITALDSLKAGQVAEAGSPLGYASCLGGYSTATHLHIARRYNGEWIPADCPACDGTQPPPFVMGGWRVIGLAGQAYQGYLLNEVDNRSVLAEQGRDSDINAISW